jgi:hypothetical protein
MADYSDSMMALVVNLPVIAIWAFTILAFKGRLDCLGTNRPSVLSCAKHKAASPTGGYLESKVPDKLNRKVGLRRLPR